MAHYTIEKHDTLPVIQATWLPEFRIERDAPTHMAEVKALLDNQTEPVFYVLDLTAWNRMSFQELMEATSIAKEGNFKHEKNRESLLVTQDITVEQAAKGMDSPAFGNIKLRVFKTIADALGYVRGQA